MNDVELYLPLDNSIFDLESRSTYCANLSDEFLDWVAESNLENIRLGKLMKLTNDGIQIQVLVPEQILVLFKIKWL